MKYFLSLLCIIKNEEYLEEFLLYHYLLGVEHFFIYDNESTIPLQKRLEHEFFRNVCTIIPFPGKVKQVEAYNHCINHTKQLTEWLAIIDGDEFILPKNHDNLVDFLKNYKDYKAIGINWMNFGSNHHEKKQPGLLMKNYTLCEASQNKHVKTICKPLHVEKVNNPHFVVLHGGNGYVDAKKRPITEKFFNEKHTIDMIQINHYWGKSYQEMNDKVERGRATMNSKRTMPPNYHKLYNDREETLIIEKYHDKLKYLTGALKADIEYYKIMNPDLKKSFKDNESLYIKHLFKHGVNEKRPYHIYHIAPHFKADIYQKNYPDLKKLKTNALIKHYIEYGLKEKRICHKLINVSS